MPNGDTDGRVMFQQIEAFCVQHPNARVYTSLGQQRYLSCIQYMDGVIGNSSSGLAEVPSFKKGSINIGDRQRGRLKAASVIDCDPNLMSISKALNQLYSPEFQAVLPAIENPYGTGGASDAIVKILQDHQLDHLLKKRFHDLSCI
jgi:GDP/UDP-N,N'-diacetylbacillosamine 2-epimerase (hydrolysing)